MEMGIVGMAAPSRNSRASAQATHRRAPTAEPSPCVQAPAISAITAEPRRAAASAGLLEVDRRAGHGGWPFFFVPKPSDWREKCGIRVWEGHGWRQKCRILATQSHLDQRAVADHCLEVFAAPVPGDGG